MRRSVKLELMLRRSIKFGHEINILIVFRKSVDYDILNQHNMLMKYVNRSLDKHLTEQGIGVYLFYFIHICFITLTKPNRRLKETLFQQQTLTQPTKHSINPFFLFFQLPLEDPLTPGVSQKTYTKSRPFNLINPNQSNGLKYGNKMFQWSFKNKTHKKRFPWFNLILLIAPLPWTVLCHRSIVIHKLKGIK